MRQISACRGVKEKIARLYRLMQIYQLKTFLYLPLFLQHCEIEQRQDQHHYQPQRHGARFSRVACIDNARTLLDSFLALYNLDPAKASMDNSVKLTGFTALAAAVVVFLNQLAADHPTPTPSEPGNEPDRILICRTIDALQMLSEGQHQSLCGQCHQALADLIHSSRTLDQGGSRQIDVPYLGLVEISRRGDHDASLDPGGNAQHMTSQYPLGAEADHGVGNSHVSGLSDDDPLAFPTFFDDMIFTYQGLWGIPGMEFFWPNPSTDDRVV